MQAKRPQTNYKIVRGNARPAPDVETFIETLSALDENPYVQARTLFDSRADIVVARAPGRLDVMGGIADYSGSLVLELPLAVATFAAAQASDDASITIRSLRAAELGGDETVVIALDALLPSSKPIDYPAARALLTANPR